MKEECPCYQIDCVLAARTGLDLNMMPFCHMNKTLTIFFKKNIFSAVTTQFGLIKSNNIFQFLECR